MKIFSERLRGWLERWLKDRADDFVLKCVFLVMLVIAAAVLALDFSQRWADAPHRSWVAPRAMPDRQTTAKPIFPFRRDGHERHYGPLRQLDAQLASAMVFDLIGDGRLLATGSIQAGTAELFAAEIAKRGSYAKTVVLHSPGGSVADAVAMGRLIREKGLATEVANGRYCASSCPIVFAGGVERYAGDRAVIGVHQVFAAAGEKVDSETIMQDAQRVSAKCLRFLSDMGVDLEVWIDAMETPKDQLFIFTPSELLSLKLATRSAKPPMSAARATS